MKPLFHLLSSALLLTSVLSGCAVVPDGMVAYRPPAAATFDEPLPLDQPEAGESRSRAQALYPYAAMSVNVYHPGTSKEGQMPRTLARLEQTCPKGSIEPLPIGRNWRLENFPADADELDRDRNLRVQLWSRQPAAGAPIDELVLVFRGTEFNHGKDWYANLRWFIRARVDHYTLTSNEIAKSLQAWLEAGIASGMLARHVTLITAGHSLGGGLAQQMAYAFRAPPRAPELRVSHVYAFDPSPVTGWFGTDKTLRERNADGLKIDRILEDGEALSYVRTALGIFVKPSDTRPTIRGVKFNFKHSYNPLSNHSMRLIACSLAKYSGPETTTLDVLPLEEE